MPEWARGRALAAQLATQAAVDPDEIFQQRQKTCPLDEVFGHAGAPLCGLRPCHACLDVQAISSTKTLPSKRSVSHVGCPLVAFRHEQRGGMSSVCICWGPSVAAKS